MNTKNDHISFDRAANYYDSTRGFPPGVAERIIASLLGYTQKAGDLSANNLLEIGVGTGRIAAPCLAQGYILTGIDLSWNMMEKFHHMMQKKSSTFRGSLLGLAQADASLLPFTAQSFDAVLAVHVLHLIPGWREVIKESRRVTRPGGSLIVGYEGRSPNSPISQMREKFDEILLTYGVNRNRILKRDYSDVDKYMLDQGCSDVDCSGAEWTTRTTLAGDIEKLTQRIWSSTWDIPDDIYAESISKIKTWAADTYGDLRVERGVPHRFVWKIYRWAKP
jgi:ubiquinone/menaquinone biosynthesis C-methylase UbiE